MLAGESFKIRITVLNETSLLDSKHSLIFKQLKILITAGGTKIPIDDVRHLGNMSKGTFGTMLAQACISEEMGHEVILFNNPESPKLLFKVVGKGPNTSWDHLKNLHFSTYDEYAQGIEEIVEKENPQIVFCSAAVSDYGVKKVEGKISSQGPLTLELIPLPKILPTIKRGIFPQKVVGFKLLSNASDQEMEKAAHHTLEKGNCDIVAANDLARIKEGKRGYTLFTTQNRYEIKSGRNMPIRFLRKILNILYH